MEVISIILLNINYAFKQIVHTYKRVLFTDLFYIYFKLFCSRTNVCTTMLFFLGFLFTFSTFWLFFFFGYFVILVVLMFVVPMFTVLSVMMLWC